MASWRRVAAETSQQDVSAIRTWCQWKFSAAVSGALEQRLRGHGRQIDARAGWWCVEVVGLRATSDVQAFLKIVVAADAQQTADQPGEMVVVQKRAGTLLAQVALGAERGHE